VTHSYVESKDVDLLKGESMGWLSEAG
jgi:hypothetical protein